MKLWKVLGVAGMAGVAATGVVVTRAERRRRAYGPDDVRARLHERYEEATRAEVPAAAPAAAEPPRGCLRSPWARAVPPDGERRARLRDRARRRRRGS